MTTGGKATADSVDVIQDVNRALHPTGLGALYDGNSACTFRVWAPFARSMSLKLLHGVERIVRLERETGGYWKAIVNGIAPGTRYLFRLNEEKERPDPASRSQPDGVHGASEVVDPGAFSWTDDTWKGVPLKDLIIYELHVGAFTDEGTFQKALSRLGHLKDLGVTALELMPVSQFPGTRNWGYDGVYPYAPQNSYGGVEGLKSLVDGCHRNGLAVILDVVYNHLGPDGNYLNDYGPYFTNRYRTPWGDAVNLDGPYSDPVRDFFIGNALYWVTEFHLDGLRLDAIDTLYDFSAHHFLKELAAAVHERARILGRHAAVIAESDLNDVRIINEPQAGGHGLDAQWCDDLHHSLHTLVTSERKGYYEDFGSLAHLQKAMQEGFVYSGGYSRYRKRRHGNSSQNCPGSRFVVCCQNHDQVGNRRLGERLSSLAGLERQKLAAGCVLLSPFLPLLFMGEEYGEEAPFQYFVSHLDEPLIEAIRRGRAAEFALFEWEGHVPDPQDEQTFLRSKVHPELRQEGRHGALFQFYRELIRIRKSEPAIANQDKRTMLVDRYDSEQVLLVRPESGRMVLALSFNAAPVDLSFDPRGGVWVRLLDSSAPAWGGPGERSPDMLGPDDEAMLQLNPFSVLLYTRAEGGRP